MQTSTSPTHNQITGDERTSFRLWLQRQFTDRCKKNARYSLRAFAKSLQMDASSVSQILSGKRLVSKKVVQDICYKLSARPLDLKTFGLLKSEFNESKEFFQINLDSFAVISDWYHVAIMELTFVSGFKADPKWIAKKLSITTEEAKAAVERLKRLGLVYEENKSLIKSSKLLTNQSTLNTSGAHREFQKQLIEKALTAVDECEANEKDITSMTMAIDERNLDKARELIRRFRRELCTLLEDGEQSRVYNLGIQLYPISKKQESEK